MDVEADRQGLGDAEAHRPVPKRKTAVGLAIRLAVTSQDR